MKIDSTDKTLTISGLTELTAANASTVRDEARARITASHSTIELDLSDVRFLDSSGLGALISLHKTMCSQNGQVRLLNPSDTAQQILELTRLHRLFEIARTP